MFFHTHTLPAPSNLLLWGAAARSGRPLAQKMERIRPQEFTEFRGRLELGDRIQFFERRGKRIREAPTGKRNGVVADEAARVMLQPTICSCERWFTVPSGRCLRTASSRTESGTALSASRSGGSASAWGSRNSTGSEYSQLNCGHSRRLTAKKRR